jgi:hypothetical protein
VRADAPPDDVGVGGSQLLAVFERGASIGCPGQLPYATLTPHAFDAQRRIELLRGQAQDEQSDRPAKGGALLTRQLRVLTW